jgi:hypothetical protein
LQHGEIGEFPDLDGSSIVFQAELVGGVEGICAQRLSEADPLLNRWQCLGIRFSDFLVGNGALDCIERLVGAVVTRRRPVRAEGESSVCAQNRIIPKKVVGAASPSLSRDPVYGRIENRPVSRRLGDDAEFAGMLRLRTRLAHQRPATT